MSLPSESKVVIKQNDGAPTEPLVLRNTEQAIITRHTANCSWEQLIRSVEVSRDEILADFKSDLALMTLKQTVAQEPFNLTLSFWKKGRLLVKKHDKISPLFEVAHDDLAESLLKKLPKMLWALKKTHTAGRADTLMVAFEYLITVDRAQAKDVVSMIARQRAENG